MRNILSLFSALFVAFVFGQTLVEYEEEEVFFYENYRKKSEPPYNSSKLKAIVSKIETNSDTLTDQTFNRLSFKEKFTYTMLYPETEIQEIESNLSEIEKSKVIFGYLPLGLDGKQWSERQINFLEINREAVINLIKQNSVKEQFIGINYKMVLEKLQAVETIPFLTDLYKNKKDKDILTLLMVLVKENQYYPFIRSNIYRDLYNEDVKNPYIYYTPAIEDYILKTAQNFYKAYKK